MMSSAIMPLLLEISVIILYLKYKNNEIHIIIQHQNNEINEIVI